MDDIRNTSALFVGGQDTAPHTERTARELWQLLFQKTENERRYQEWQRRKITSSLLYRCC